MNQDVSYYIKHSTVNKKFSLTHDVWGKFEVFDGNSLKQWFRKDFRQITFVKTFLIIYNTPFLWKTIH